MTNTVTEEKVSIAKDMGCVAMSIGIESGNPEILRHIKKSGKVDTFLQAAEMLHKYPQINARALLIIGFPDETLGMIFDTIKLRRIKIFLTSFTYFLKML